jgi:hypothetical protein
MLTGSTDFAPRPVCGWNYLLMRQLGQRVFGVFLVVTSLVYIGFAVHDNYAYFEGASTTTKIEHCTQGNHFEGGHRGSGGGGPTTFTRRVNNAILFPAEGCTGMWLIDGASYSGPVVGGDVFTEGRGYPTPIDVRVLGGTAYTVNSLEDSWGATALAVLFLVGGVYFLVRRRRGLGDSRPIESASR